ncbi:MAG: hypothetical protein LBR06_01890 [Bacteroidales bacterium]|jgi:hypothetical protein|nr:hypothetical protein [Bacteroidales bacterium]
MEIKNILPQNYSFLLFRPPQNTRFLEKLYHLTVDKLFPDTLSFKTATIQSILPSSAATPLLLRARQ